MKARRPKSDRTVEGSDAAPVSQAREEILRLIARLQSGRDGRGGAGEARSGRDAPRPAERATPSSASRATSGRAPSSASELRRLRESLEERLSDARLSVRLGALEKRVARLDAVVARRRPSVGPPAHEVEHTISGALRGQLMADMLQLVSSNGLTGVFVVNSGGAENRLYLEEGQICHAEGLGLEGESAFFASMAAEEGRYYFEETTDLPEERTITGNTQFLILEALRKIDEGETE